MNNKKIKNQNNNKVEHTKEKNKKVEKIKEKKKSLRACGTVLTAKDLLLVYKNFIKEIPKEALRLSTLEDGTVYTLYGYQFIINRLNDVVGFEHWNIKVITEPRSEKRNNFWFVSLSLTLSLGNWTSALFIPLVSKVSYGSGASENLGNALKGALTNGFKKAAAMYGIGKKAYEGLIEDYDILKNGTKKIVKIKTALTESQKELLTTFERALMVVNNKKTLLTVEKTFNTIKGKFSPTQLEYTQKLLNRLKRKYKK